jgi:hypothetical protein
MEQRIKDILVPIREFDNPTYHKSRQNNIEDISIKWISDKELREEYIIGSPYMSTKVAKEPDLIELDEVLEQLCPAISLLTYKKLVRNLVEYDTKVFNGYDYTGESEKKVNIRKLAEYLVENNI